MDDQPQNGGGNKQQPQPERVNDEQPRCDAALQPCSGQQAPPNQIADVPNRPVAQQQQLPPNNVNPPIPMNGRQLNGPFNQPPPVVPQQPLLNRDIDINSDLFEYQIPHYHLTIEDREWTYNDTSQRVPVRRSPSPPVRRPEQPRPPPPPVVQPQPYQHPPRRHGVNECHLLFMNRRRCLATSNDLNLNPPVPKKRLKRKGLYSQPPRLMPALPPLVSRQEVEPGIFEEIYSNYPLRNQRRTMFGVHRCICQDFMHYNIGNDEMITVIMNTPNLSQRISMTAYREEPFIHLFRAYYSLIPEATKGVFVAGGRRLKPYETPINIGLKDRDIIHVFVEMKGFNQDKLPPNDLYVDI